MILKLKYQKSLELFNNSIFYTKNLKVILKKFDIGNLENLLKFFKFF